MSTEQRGSGWSIKLVFNFYKLLGYKFIYYLMYPVTFFYFLVATNVKEALKNYYLHINKPFSNLIYFEHLRYFAITMCDRFVSKVSPKDYTFKIAKEDELMETLQAGCILLLSHFGGWATAGNCFMGLTINIVMQEVILRDIKKVEESVHTNQNNIHIIDLSKGGISVSLEIASALLRNEIVAMMVDRTTHTKNNQVVTFFNQEANFNKNPFNIAYKTGKPLIGLAIVYQKPQCYTIEFIKITMNKYNPQAEETQKAMQTYADFFSCIVFRNPKQWFNFYNFWKEEK